VQRYIFVVLFVADSSQHGKGSIRWKLLTGDKLYSNLNSFALPELVSGPIDISLHVQGSMRCDYKQNTDFFLDYVDGLFWN
jgi:hypothetical protein